jgi:hypothetical protein
MNKLEKYKPFTLRSSDCVFNSTTKKYSTTNGMGAYPGDIKFARVCKIQFNHSYYNIYSSNNVLKTSLGNITIPAGNYTSGTLQSTVQTLLVAIDATFTCAFDSATAKYTIARGAGNFDLTLATSTINKIMGFNYVDKTGAATYTSDNAADLATHYVTFHSRNISKKVFCQISDGRSEMVCEIPDNTAFGYDTVYIPDDDIVFEIDQNQNIGNDEFYFKRSDGNVVDFNGVDWTITIRYVEKI